MTGAGGMFSLLPTLVTGEGTRGRRGSVKAVVVGGGNPKAFCSSTSSGFSSTILLAEAS